MKNAFFCFLAISFCASCDNGAYSESLKGENYSYILRLGHCTEHYNAGEEFERESDFNVYLLRNDSIVLNVRNRQCSIYIDGEELLPNEPYYVTQSAIVRIVYKAYSVQYKIKVGDGDFGDGSSGTGGGSGGTDIGWEWGPGE